MTLPVSHYLKIYQLRQKMAQSGITHSNGTGLELIDQLVNRLARLAPELPCHLVRTPATGGGEWIAFMVEGEEQARVFMPTDDGVL